MKGVNWRRVLTFLGITYAIDWAIAGGLWLSGAPLPGPVATAVAMAYMVVPAAVAIVLARRWEVPLASYGVRVPRNWYLALAPLAPMLLAVMTIAVAVLLGFAQYDPSGAGGIERMERIAGPQTAEQMRSAWETLPVNPLLLALLSAPIAGFTINGLFAFGEELGWRGLLQQALAPLGFARASMLIGFVWGLWHAPLILQGHNFPEHPRLGVLVMIAACIPLGILMSWLALRAQTVIAAAVAHGTFNAAAGITLLAMRGGEAIEILPLGYAGIVAMVPLVLVVLALRPPVRYEDLQEPGDEMV